MPLTVGTHTTSLGDSIGPSSAPKDMRKGSSCSVDMVDSGSLPIRHFVDLV